MNIQWVPLCLSLTGKINPHVMFCLAVVPVCTKTGKDPWYCRKKKQKTKPLPRNEDNKPFLKNVVFIAIRFPSILTGTNRAFRLFVLQPSDCYQGDWLDGCLLSLSSANCDCQQKYLVSDEVPLDANFHLFLYFLLLL